MGHDVHSQLQWEVNFYADIMVSLKRTYTTEDTRQLTVSQRKCIFFDEVQFQYYPQDKYTFTGCMKECRMKKCLQFCKCLPPFYKPKGAYRPCNIVDMECLARKASEISDIRDCGHCELPCDTTVFDLEKVIKT
jgi:acid-sensing ion channel, other